MGIWQAFRVALEMLRLHKLRAFLTMLGVIIGVMAVTVIVMISSGFQSYMTNLFTKVGADSIYVVFDPGMRARREGRGTSDGLKIDDANFLRERVKSLAIVSPLSSGAGGKVVYADREFTGARVNGQDENYGLLIGEEFEQGRGIDQSDIANRQNVCVIGDEVRDRLFPDKNALGKYITLPGITLEVVGILKRQDVFGQSNGKDIRMPLTTLQDKWTGQKTLQLIACKPKAGVTVEAAMDDIWQAMMARSGNKRIYRVDSNESIGKVFSGIFGAAGGLLAAIAALSLLVGGIGIMNIMLVSVTERTKEIGLRKAIGARGVTILTQFLVESATLSLIGGLIGMGVAYGLGKIVSLITMAMKFPQEGGLATPFPVAAGIASALFSAFIGVIFGLYPAYSASKLDPIVALRRE